MSATDSSLAVGRSAIDINVAKTRHSESAGEQVGRRVRHFRRDSARQCGAPPQSASPRLKSSRKKRTGAGKAKRAGSRKVRHASSKPRSVARVARGASSARKIPVQPVAPTRLVVTRESDALADGVSTAELLSDWGLAGLESIDRPRLAPAGTGDHQGIYQFLLAAFQSPTHEAFLATLEDPLYEPSDRWLVKRGDQVLGHVRLTRRVMQFGPLSFPTAEVVSLGVLPEFRGHGFGRELVAAVNRALVEDQAVIATLRTGIPQFFGRAGWSVCGRHSWSRANTRELLAAFLPDETAGDSPSRFVIRPWRQVELPALVRLYRDEIARGAGGWQRTEAMWRWLLGRKNSDQVFVAIDGPDRLELDDANAPIVGYLVLRDDAIIELVASPEHPQVARQLIARACSEGMERNHHHAITLHAPSDNPAHQWFVQAGGVQQQREADQGQVGMAKIVDPQRYLEMLAPLLHERADRAGLDRPTELGILVGRDRYRLVITRRSVKLGRPRIGRSYLSLGRGDFTRLLAGHLDLDEAVANGQVAASTRIARETASVLFPRLPLWRSPLDDPAC